VRCQLPAAILTTLEPLDGNVRIDLARDMADESPEVRPGPTAHYGPAPPQARTQARALTWRYKRTKRDDRLAKRSGRPITKKNLRRPLLRQLWRATE
jgi:hypothetical protein